MNDPIPDPLRWLIRRRPSIVLSPVQDAFVKLAIGLLLAGVVGAVIDRVLDGLLLVAAAAVVLALALTEPHQ